jgi:hypothetical protein
MHGQQIIKFFYAVPNVEVNLTRKFMTGILATNIIYIFILLTSHWSKREFYIRESKSITTYQYTLNLSLKIPNTLNLN